MVFPTHVGVFPIPSGQVRDCSCLPHARGGVSVYLDTHFFFVPSSPRTWGCFLYALVYGRNEQVFPTHVGVFLTDITVLNR